MLIQQTLERLHELRLTGMARALEEQLAIPDTQSLGFDDRFAFLVEREVTCRHDRRLTRHLHLAKLRLSACVEDIDFRSPRGLDKSLLVRLAGCDWVRAQQIVLISGATGTGKSFLACALGHSACRHGLSTRYFRLSRLLGALAIARADGSYARTLERLARTDLLILDDFGLAPLSDGERRDLLELLEDRHNRRATLMTSQLPLNHWHEAIGDPTLADAILDRLVHQAHRITLKGPSMRAHSRNGRTEPEKDHE